MAARRLIVVLVVLFAISIAAAAVAPERQAPFATEDESTATTTTTDREPVPPSGEELSESIIGSVEDPETVEVEVGDQLELDVVLPRGGQVEIPDLGLLETAGTDAPAQFSILLREAGTLAIIDAESGDVIGRLVVAEPGEPAQSEGKERADGEPAGG